MFSRAKFLLQFRSCSTIANLKSPIKMDFYYDTISPYSWLAFEVALRYKKAWNMRINLKPVFMAGLYSAVGNKFFDSLVHADMSNKARYLLMDIERVGRYYEVPIRQPENLFYILGVAGSLKPQRFLTAVKHIYPECVEGVSRQIWYRIWTEDMDIAKQNSLMMVGVRGGLTREESAACINAMEMPNIKEDLMKATKEAETAGAYGLPFLVFKGKEEDEIFFGSDRFELIAHRLGLIWKGPVLQDQSNSLMTSPLPPKQSDLFVKLEKFDAINKKYPPAAVKDMRELI